MDIAPDRLADLTRKYYCLIDQNVPPKLAFMEIAIKERLSLLEVDQFWDFLIKQVEDMRQTEAVVAASQGILTNMMQKLDQLKQTAASKRAEAIRHGVVYPASVMATMAQNVVDSLKLDREITASEILCTINRMDEDFDIMNHLATKVYGNSDSLTEVANHLEGMLIGSVACILEQKGYGYNHNTDSWEVEK
jgi:hypothetical protein